MHNKEECGNYLSFLYENIKLKFKNIDDNQINKIYFDIINGTLYSNNEYHLWIQEHIKKIIPSFNNKIKSGIKPSPSAKLFNLNTSSLRIK